MAKKVKLPKRIAGVKVPKEMRRTVERAIEGAQSPRGQEMIAAALSMAAAGASAAVVRARTARDAPPAPPTPPETPVPPVPPRPPEGAAAKPEAQQVAEAFGQVAEQMLGRLFGGKR